MIKISQLNELINAIPSILQYVIPGTLCVLLYEFILSKKYNVKYVLFFGCIISYVLLSFVSFINEVFFPNLLLNNVLVTSFITTFLGLVLTFILGIICNSKIGNDIIVFFFGKNTYDNIWRDIIDYKQGSNLKIFLKNKNYYIIGHFNIIEEKEDESWLVLKGFAKYNVSNNKEIEDHLEDKPENPCIAIRVKDIDYFEVY